MSNNGKGFEFGQYEGQISLSIPMTQPKQFRDLAGIEYENLTGQLVKSDGVELGPTINYAFDFSIS